MAEIVRYGQLDWHVPPGVTPDEAGQALRRARVVQGEAGWFANVIDCPPGTVLPPHSHDHAELFVVLGGSCSFGGTTLRPFDTIAIDANEEYGMVAGGDGLRFLVVRSGEANLRTSDGAS